VTSASSASSVRFQAKEHGSNLKNRGTASELNITTTAKHSKKNSFHRGFANNISEPETSLPKEAYQMGLGS